MTFNDNNMMSEPELTLIELYIQYTGIEPELIAALPASGSDRSYYRLFGNGSTVIGAYNEVVKENEAFLYFSDHFKKCGLSVPVILQISNNKKAYLQTDLGDENLFSILSTERWSEQVKGYYREAVKCLPAFQIMGIRELDLTYCYPREHFDKQSMMWDFNYFKYYFARLAGINFDEQALEDDFKTLASFLLTAHTGYFMFRDFQSRNIMINEGKPCFIDYQGGRSGPLQYDLASLLYDAKANLPADFRNELIEVYLHELEKYPASVSRADFMKYFDGFVLIRILQALGAYGFRGYYQKKEHFLQSIPFALQNLKSLLEQPSFQIRIPELRSLLEKCMNDPKINKLSHESLKVRVTSFSYKQGIPVDHTGNGGGFVFDCRALPNPGRLVEFQQQSGLDKPVIEYLKGFPEMEYFLDNVFSLVDQAVKNYRERDFGNLMVNFGCTGGRHRSVYCAVKLAQHLNQKFGMNIKPEHTEKHNW